MAERPHWMAWCSVIPREDETCTGFYPSRVPIPEKEPPPSRWFDVSLPAPAPGCRWFDVALWYRWGDDRFWLAYDNYVQASGAFLAVECLMRHHQVRQVPYASARALDRSIVYRAYDVWVELLEGETLDE